MVDQNYKKLERIREWSAKGKYIGAGLTVTSLATGSNVLMSVSFGLYILGDIIYHSSDLSLEELLKSDLEKKLIEEPVKIVPEE